ncbi:MAG: hypothetical protein ACI97B_003970, partial [Verrucomicrobiales bacterium]
LCDLFGRQLPDGRGLHAGKIVVDRCVHIVSRVEGGSKTGIRITTPVREVKPRR